MQSAYSSVCDDISKVYTAQHRGQLNKGKSNGQGA